MALQRLVVDAGLNRGTSSSTTASTVGLDELFRSQMQMYQSYWRDDPEFDVTNTLRAVPQLPCPDVDSKVMWRLAKYAIENNFGWPVPPPLPAPLDVAERLNHAVLDRHDRNGRSGMIEIRVGFDISGPGGGQWTLLMHGSEIVELADGIADNTIPIVYMTSTTFARIADADMSSQQALRVGGLVMCPAGVPQETVLNAVNSAAGNPNLKPPWRPTHHGAVAG